MSLMLDALKRIEAKQASTRAAAPHVEVSKEPAIATATVEATDHDWSAISVDDAEPAPFEAPIELPPELFGDGLDDIALEETALPDAAWMEEAMSELSELLAEARLLDQPVAAEPSVAYTLAEVVVDTDSQDNNVRWESPLHDEIASEPPADAAISLAELPSTPIADFDPEPEPTLQVAEPAIEELATSAADSAPYFEETAELRHDASVVPQRRSAADAPAEVFADAPVITPLGSDPYAAAAWQILRQLPLDRSQVLQFTSPGDGHGKTTTLARLLPHVARTFEGNVLVVDANTRNPDLARRLEVAVTWRLTDVLSGATHWMNAVRATSLPRVSLLPGGTAALRRHDLRTAAALLRELSGHYDLVLIDTTSLAHEGAAQLASTCDGTCLVVRLGEGSRRIVRESVRVIDSAGGRLLGCIAIDAGE
jgi:Mrp family chromosome partitioning ATPase